MSGFPIGAIGGPVEAQLPSRPFCGLALVGEAPGKDEVLQGVPFSGAAGAVLDAMLEKAGIDRAACLVANPFRYRPEGNRIGLFFASKARAKAEGLAINTRLAPFQSGYCLAPHDQDVRILWRILREHAPRAILTMGNTALWSLTFQTGILKLAGQTFRSEACAAPIVATYHPSYLLRQRSPETDAAFLSHLRAAAALAGLA